MGLYENAELISKNARRAMEMCNRIYAGGSKAAAKDLDRTFRYFRLRPTTNGITVYSVLDYAPMRGVSKNADELEDFLITLKGHIPKLLSESANTEELLCTLKELGFNERIKRKEDELEEDIQASFIRDMLAGNMDYAGISFLASELNLEDDKRFDVVGCRDNVLYIFELKKGRTKSIFEQLNRYRDQVNEYKEAFEKVLSVYPLAQLDHINEVKAVAVMKWAENSAVPWEELAEKNNAEVWFFKPSLTYNKINH